MVNPIRWLFGHRDKRAIFRYHDGQRDRCIDPMVAWRDLDEHKTFNLEEHPRQALDGDWTAIQTSVAAVREIFGVPAWSETAAGLTEGETLRILWAFLNYAGEVKKNTKIIATSPSLTAPASSAPSTTKPVSDSSSISPEPKSEPAPASCSPCETPTPAS